jgi:hypothetical protein
VVVVVVVVVEQMVDIPTMATTTYSLALIVSTFLFLMFFGGIIICKKKKKTVSSTNNAVDGEALSASGANLYLTSGTDGGAVQEVDDAMSRHGDSKTSRYVVYYIRHVHYL